LRKRSLATPFVVDFNDGQRFEPPGTGPNERLQTRRTETFPEQPLNHSILPRTNSQPITLNFYRQVRNTQSFVVKIMMV